MTTEYQMRRARRAEARHVGGRFKAGLLAPVMAHKFMGGEAAMISQTAAWELDQVPGKLLSPIKGEVISVYVPLQAIHALKYPTADYPGSNDVIRAALAANETMFDLEAETELSKRLGINPVMDGGVAKVCETARLAYICANNFLRTRKFVKAQTVDKNSTAVLPAILSRTVLDRLNAVLDPEDRVNGAVQLEGRLELRGIGVAQAATTSSPNPKTVISGSENWAHGYSDSMRLKAQSEDGLLDLWSELADATTGISLTDFYQAEKQDQIVRKLRQFVDRFPEQGEEIITRYVRGLNLDVGRQPFVLHERQIDLNASVVRAMDGANLDMVQTFPGSEVNFTVAVPATEFGGVVITMMAIKPDEVLADQPHPFFTKPWGADNFAADELAVDPVPVRMRELYSDVAVGDEDTVALYVGNHGLRRNYEQYGWNRHLDPNDVAAETSIWQLAVPMSVTPQSVLYPASLPQTPFADTLAEVCTYSIMSVCNVQTPTIFGPSPVEELAAIEDEDVFEEE